MEITDQQFRDLVTVLMSFDSIKPEGYGLGSHGRAALRRLDYAVDPVGARERDRVNPERAA